MFNNLLLCLFSDTTITAGIWIHIMLVSAKDHNTKEMELFINTIQQHPTNKVKLRKCELSTSTGKCGYRTLNFKFKNNF
jgi:hypothetical protein